MSSRRAMFVCSALFVGLAGACSSPLLPVCTGNVQLSVSGASATPTIDWTPRCAVSTLEVNDTAAHADTWILNTLTPEILPPVTYGQIPYGGQQVGNIRGLVSGRVYLIALTAYEGGDDVFLGKVTYTPAADAASSAFGRMP